MTADEHRRRRVRSVTRRIASTIKARGHLPKAEYRKIVADVAAALAARPLPDAQVYPQSMGAFPLMVKEVLGSLTDRVQQAVFMSAEEESRLAEPAPWEHDDLDIIDSQWYFDMPSVRRIISCFPEDTKSVVALGTPTVAAMAGLMEVPEVTLVDISRRFMSISRPAWLDAHRVERVRQDLNAKPYDGVSDADVVVMDPPWYVESYRAWLKSAEAVCKPDGLIAVALPQLLTNSRSFLERQEIIQRLEEIGQVSIRPDALTYVSPSFELGVLETDELDFLRRWRHADLALVQVERGSGRRRDPRDPAEERYDVAADHEWYYREILGRVVRTCLERRDEGTLPVLKPMDSKHGYRLTGVGRSYLWRSEPDLVTSRGRAAKVWQWGELPRILDLMQSGRSLAMAVLQALPGASVAAREGLVATLRTILER